MSQSKQIKDYFSTNRITWEQFYESERIVIEKMWDSSCNSILDIGCGCAGLYAALKQKFNLTEYVGVELDSAAAEYAKMQYPEITIVNSDFEKYETNSKSQFDVVFSLGCFDWNTNLEADPLESFYSMFKKSWQMVKNGGSLIISLRLDSNITIMDIKKSFQFINYMGEKNGDIANYSVISAHDCFRLFKSLNPASITGYGYFGKPGITSVTSFDKVCFAVFAIKKSENDGVECSSDVTMPIEIKNIYSEYFKNL